MTPNPGSPEAVGLGCACPVMDNHRGKGAWGGARDENGEVVFWRNEYCKLHGFDIDEGHDHEWQPYILGRSDICAICGIVAIAQSDEGVDRG